MSYILDALRRADEQRQRHALRTPTLGSDQPSPTHPARWRLTRLALVTSSAAAVVIGAWFAWHGPRPADPADADRHSRPGTTPVDQATPQVAAAPAPGAEPLVAPTPNPAATRPDPGIPDLAVTTKRPVAAPPTPQIPAPPESARSPRSRAVAAISAVSVATPRTASREPQDATASLESTGSTAGRVSTDPAAVAWHDLPSELRRGLPRPRLDVHVYADDPAARFIMVGMRKYREGEVLPDGSVLERIDAESIQLGYRDQHYTLPRH